MSEQILQVNFRLNVPVADYRRMTSSLAEAFATLPGLRWKIWMLNEERGEAGGLYLFDGPESLAAFLHGPLAKQVAAHPALGDFRAQMFDVMPEVTALTRGPVGVAAGV